MHDRQIADLRATTAAHDRQIEALIQATMENTRLGKDLDRRIEAVVKLTEETSRNLKILERQWQAYLNTLPRQ